MNDVSLTITTGENNSTPTPSILVEMSDMSLTIDYRCCLAPPLSKAQAEQYSDRIRPRRYCTMKNQVPRGGVRHAKHFAVTMVRIVTLTCPCLVGFPQG